MLKRSLVVLFCFSILACSDEIESAWDHQHTGHPLEVEKKYYLKDCVIKIAFLWDDELQPSEKYQIIDEMLTRMKFAIVSSELPLFSGGTTREAAYIVIYYSDWCEDRIDMTNKLIEDYFLPNVEGFPDVSIETDVKPGFDGSTPSGWWLDY